MWIFLELLLTQPPGCLSVISVHPPSDLLCPTQQYYCFSTQFYYSHLIALIVLLLNTTTPHITTHTATTPTTLHAPAHTLSPRSLLAHLGITTDSSVIPFKPTTYNFAAHISPLLLKPTTLATLQTLSNYSSNWLHTTYLTPCFQAYYWFPGWLTILSLMLVCCWGPILPNRCPSVGDALYYTEIIPYTLHKGKLQPNLSAVSNLMFLQSVWGCVPDWMFQALPCAYRTGTSSSVYY